MDVDAVVRRAPELALVDELAHTNAPGSRNDEALPGHRRDPRSRHRRRLDGQHPASREPERRGLRADGRPRPGDVPRPRADDADEVVLVDLSPEALQDRLRARQGLSRAAGPSGRCSNFFRQDNLSTLRELALREVAEDVEARRSAAELDPLSKQAVGRARPRPRRAAAALAARPAARVALGAAPRRRDRRAVDAPARAAARRRRMRRSSPRCVGSPRSSACTSSRRRATTSSTRYGGSSLERGSTYVFVGTPDERALGRDHARLARLAHDPRAARDRHPRRRAPRAAGRAAPMRLRPTPAPRRTSSGAAAPARPVHGEAARPDGARRRAADRAGGGRGARARVPPRRAARVQPRSTRPARRAPARDADPRGGRARRPPGGSAGRRADRAREVAHRRAPAALVRGVVRPGHRPRARRRATRASRPKDLAWMLTHAPGETLILRPRPEEPEAPSPSSPTALA